MSRFRPLCLAFVLWFAVCAAQQPTTSPSPEAPASASTAPASLGDQGLNSLQGLKVSSITVKSEAVQDSARLVQSLPQKVNQPLDKYKVRDSVQALYNTGRFAEIQVEATRTAPNEVGLTFAARENYFVGSIRSEGSTSSPTDSQLVSSSKLVLGELFTDDKVREGMDHMQLTLQESGYYKAAIHPSYQWDPRNQQVHVLFQVDKGRAARIGAIKLTGDSDLTLDQVSKISGLHTGDHVTADHLTRALRRLRKHFQSEERLEAQVVMTERTYHPDTNTLDYTFDIDRGPVVDVRVEGAKLSPGKIRKFVPVYEENAVDDDLLNEGARNLRDYFQSKGYFDVKVSYTRKQQPGSDRQDVVYTIYRGERHKLVLLAINGNHYFSREEIRERMALQPAGGLLLWGTFSQSLLNRDIQAIQTLYINNGFRDIKITPQVTDNYGGKKGRLKVALNIQEGAQTTVGKLTIEGNSAVPTDKVLSMLSAREGQPYSDSMVMNDQTEVTDGYFNLGFPHMRFDYQTLVEPQDPTKVDVSYKITEGPQIYVDKVLYSGLHYTKGFVVQREMKIQPNEPLSQQDMLDSQRGLYDLGIFNEVNMAVQNPEGDATHKNVDFQFSEAKRYTFNYGVGFEVQTGQPTGTTNPQGKTGVSPTVSFDVTRLNFRGRDHTITLKTRFGNLEKLGLIGYEAPSWFDFEHLSLNLTAFYEQTNDVRTFTAKRLEGSAQIKQELDRATTLLYRLIFRRVSTTNLVIDPNLVPLFSQPVRVGMPDFSYLRDTRDNPIESSKGSFTSFDIGVASGAFGSEPSFTRLALQNSTYYQFHKRRWVFARSTRIGIEEPFGSTSAAIAAPGPGAPSPTSFIPLPERFLAGGSTTHRGFGINQAGPRDLTTGFPLGGEALFINNLELRTPPLPFPWVGNNLSAVIFHDMGNVFTTPDAMVRNLFRYSQQNRSACLSPTTTVCNFDYVSHAIGGGIRYRTPVGPVSLDVGYNLNPPAFPITAPTDGTQPRAETLRRFNLFFNIGQTF
ncbi:MAG TPA: POTRA domain-containing protein [Candidatus Angelobacter sp.]|nr:POTRA domain-containing protein [Candidatus Angelobacter sp.]